MASVQTYSKGRRRVRFRDHRDNERSLALGKIPMRAARSAADHIQALVNAKGGGFQPDAEHVKWAGEQRNRVIDSLADLGLIPERKKPAAEKKQKSIMHMQAMHTQYRVTQASRVAADAAASLARTRARRAASLPAAEEVNCVHGDRATLLSQRVTCSSGACWARSAARAATLARFL